MSLTRRIGLAVAVAVVALLGGMAGRARAVVLTFEDIPLGPDGTSNVFGLYQAPGSDFVLLGDFQARGDGASSAITPETQQGSGEVSTSLSPFAGTITLTRADGLPFSLLSIDLERENLFNRPSDTIVNFPVITFVGFRADGTATDPFTVEVSRGDPADFFFRTYVFPSEFTNLLAVNWLQPAFLAPDPNDPGRALGQHQIDNIRLEVAPIPEPSTLALGGVGLVGLGLGYARRRRKLATA